MEKAHTRSVTDVTKHFDTNLEKGLSDKQVEEYQLKYGPNGELCFETH